MRRPVFASPMKLFKPRSRTRDAKTDTARTAAIFTAIETACLDIEAERKGLVNRYERAKLRAGDLLAAVDSGEDSGLRVPLDEMEEAMTYSERRVREIDAMRAAYDELLRVARELLKPAS
jgi:hypothetical protein